MKYFKKIVIFAIMTVLVFPLSQISANDDIDEKTSAGEAVEEIHDESKSDIRSENSGINVSTFEELKNAIQEKKEIINVLNDIEVIETLAVESDLTLLGANGSKLVSSLMEHEYLFSISDSTTSFVIKNLALEGNSKSKAITSGTVKGDFVLENVKVSNFNTYKGSVISFNSQNKTEDDLIKILIQSSTFDDNFSNGNPSNITGSVIQIGINAELSVIDSNFDNHGNTSRAILQNINYVSSPLKTANSVTIQNSSFRNLVSGDGGSALRLLYNGVDSTINIVDSTFDSNKTLESTGQGGAVDIVDYSKGLNSVSVTTENSKFTDNTSEKSQAGAFHALNTSSAIFTDVEFNNNATFTTGGALVVNNLGGVKTGELIINGTHNKFTNNNVLKASASGSKGGAINIIGGVDTTITNAVFNFNESNSEGGAISATTAVATENAYKFDLSRSEFNGNSTRKYSGGAINLYGKYDTSISQTVFNENKAAYGGALHITQDKDVSEPKLNIEQSEFNSNEALSTYGGAIIIQSNFHYNASITETIFNSNTADRGGAIFSFLAPRKDATSASQNIVIADSEFIENNATIYGGAIATTVQNGSVPMTENYKTTVDINGSKFDKNTSEGNAGAIIIHNNANLSIDTSTFTENSSGLEGGSVYFTSDVDMQNQMEISNSSFEKNHAKNNGGALAISTGAIMDEETSDADYATYFASTAIKDTKFADNTAGNGAYILEEELYPLTWKVAKTNVIGTQSLSKPFLIKKNVAYNNYDISAMSDKPVEDVTINYVSNGGSIIDSESITYNTSFTKPENPTREGYSFVDWYLDLELTEVYDFSEAASSDVTVYAKWSKIVISEESPKLPTTGISSNYNGVMLLLIGGMLIAYNTNKRKTSRK